MKRERGGLYRHNSFTELHGKSGSGYYMFTERVGLGGIFHLSSSGVTPYSPKDDGPDVKVHDIYDVLRAVELGRVHKLVKEDVAI